VLYCSMGNRGPRPLIVLGMAYGLLTPVVLMGVHKAGSMWICKCKCGRFVIQTGHELNSGVVRDCGCKSVQTKRRFYSGAVIGRFTLIKSTAPSTWLCKCNVCGTKSYRNTNRLGTVCSSRECGCLRSRDSITTGRNVLYERYSRSAGIRGFSWELTKDDVSQLISQDCVYCGRSPMTVMHKNRKHGNGAPQSLNLGRLVYNGIDRVDNTKGYILGNVVACCHACNTAKHVMSIEQFRIWVQKVYSRMDEWSLG
jgi:5-methylcytosine-specific restriction endonuclease McrA